MSNLITNSAERKNLADAIKAFRAESAPSSITPDRAGALMEKLLSLSKTEVDALQVSDVVMNADDIYEFMKMPKVVLLEGQFNNTSTTLSLSSDAYFNAVDCVLGKQMAFLKLTNQISSQQSALIPVTIFSLSNVYYFSFIYRNTIYTIYNFPASGNVSHTPFTLNSFALDAVASQTVNGLMSATDKKKLDKIDEEANKYELPIAAASKLGGVKSTTTGKTAGRDYNVEVLADGSMKVNVPWTDTISNDNNVDINPESLIGKISFQQMLEMNPNDIVTKGENFHKIYIVDNYGILEVFIDHQMHQVTQTFLSNYYAIGNEGLGGHTDGKIFRLYRCYGMGLGGDLERGWTEWKLMQPDEATAESAGLMSATDKAKLDAMPEVIILSGLLKRSSSGSYTIRLTRNSNFILGGPGGSASLIPDNKVIYLKISGELVNQYQGLLPVNFYYISGIKFMSFYFSGCIFNVNDFPNSYWDVDLPLQQINLVSLKDYPMITPAQLSDGNTYGLRNGQLELVAWNGYDVMVQQKASAASLANAAIRLGQIPYGLEPEMIEEIHSLLGDEIFNDLAVASAATLEMKPQVSEKELLEQAKAEYLAFKASMAQNVDTLEVNDIDIVKPKKS